MLPGVVKVDDTIVSPVLRIPEQHMSPTVIGEVAMGEQSLVVDDEQSAEDSDPTEQSVSDFTAQSRAVCGLTWSLSCLVTCEGPACRNIPTPYTPYQLLAPQRCVCIRNTHKTGVLRRLGARIGDRVRHRASLRA